MELVFSEVAHVLDAERSGGKVALFCTFGRNCHIVSSVRPGIGQKASMNAIRRLVMTLTAGALELDENSSFQDAKQGRQVRIKRIKQGLLVVSKLVAPLLAARSELFYRLSSCLQSPLGKGAMQANGTFVVSTLGNMRSSREKELTLFRDGAHTAYPLNKVISYFFVEFQVCVCLLCCVPEWPPRVVRS